MMKLDAGDIKRGQQVVYMPVHALPTQNISHADVRYGVITSVLNTEGMVTVRFLSVNPETKRWNGKVDSGDRLLLPTSLYTWNALSQDEIDTILTQIGE